MVFIPRAQPLCRPVTLPMTLRGETEGILSFLPSIPVKSFIIQLPDYFKKLTRLWFVCVCETERGRESEQQRGIAGGGMHPVALTTPSVTPVPSPLIHPLPPTPQYNNLLDPTKLLVEGKLPPPPSHPTSSPRRFFFLPLSLRPWHRLFICVCVFICVQFIMHLSVFVCVCVHLFSLCVCV